MRDDDEAWEAVRASFFQACSEALKFLEGSGSSSSGPRAPHDDKGNRDEDDDHDETDDGNDPETLEDDEKGRPDEGDSREALDEHAS